MAVTIDDVRHIAALARLGLDDERAATLVARAEHDSRAHGRVVEGRHAGHRAGRRRWGAWRRRCGRGQGPSMPLAARDRRVRAEIA